MNSTLRLPYPGLRAFTREESDLFFGRESCVDMMVDRLAETRFLAVLGPSGSGKSSLVRTGLLDALDLGLLAAAGSHWKIADLHPGGQPMRKLAAALLQLQQEDALDNGEIDHLTEVLSQGPRSIIQWASSGNLPQESNLLILVDQFEELFRYGDYAQREEAEAFVSSLLESSSSPKAPIYIVITMRSEYLGACSSIAGLAEHISAGLYLTPRMDREECREAIVGPAGVVGFSIEPALVNRLLNDLSSFAPWEASEDRDLAAQLARQADQLPLMQHVLNRLWLRAQGEVTAASIELRLSEYEQIGGLSGALDAHGAEVIAGLGSSRLPSIESVFRTLVSGTSLATAVRRPCRISELIEVTGGQRDDVKAIVEAFSAPGCNFLRVSDPSLNSDAVIVDISHESLIRQWTPLRQWLEREVRDGAAWRRLISAQERYEHREGGLLTGLDYQSLAAWWSSAKPTPIWAARHGDNFESTQKFLEASAEAEEFQANAERRRQQGERRRMQAGIAALAVVLAAVSTLSWTLKREVKKANSAWGDAARSKAQLQEKNTELRQSLKQTEDATGRERAASVTAAKVINGVSDYLYSDRSGRPVGMAQSEGQLMDDMGPYQDYMSREGAISSAERIRNDYRHGRSKEMAGEADAALTLYGKTFQEARDLIQATPAGEQLPSSLIVDFANDGYRYSWMLLDIGETERGQEVLQQIELVLRQHPARNNSAEELVTRGKLETLEFRYGQLKNQPALDQHSLRAYLLAERAMAMPSPTIATKNFAFGAYRNRSLDIGGQLKYDLQAAACRVADDMLKKNPMDEDSIINEVDCLLFRRKDEFSGDPTTKHRALGDAKQRALEAQELLRAALRLGPNDQDLLLSMAGTENRLAQLSYVVVTSDSGYVDYHTGSKTVKLPPLPTLSYEPAEEDKHKLAAQRYFVAALQGKTIFQSKVSEVSSLYTGFIPSSFPPDKPEIVFYREILNAVVPTLQKFPKTPSFAYVAGDASNRIAKVLADSDPRHENRKHLKEEENSLTKAIMWFDVSGVMKDLSVFSEDFATYCGAYEEREKIYAETGNMSSMLRDAQHIRKSCQVALDKYPWNFWLRQAMWISAYTAGHALFEHQRYLEALSYLNYASHWGDGDATKMLARIYRGGLGIPADERQAKNLESLAEKQAYKSFMIPVDFGGVQAPFNIYVREWPPEYIAKFPGIDDQVKWLSEARGGTVSSEVVDAFHKLQKIAIDNDVSFPELVAYALNSADNKDKKEPTAKTSETSSDSDKKAEAPVSTNKEAQAEYERAVSLAASGKWEEAAQAAEQALEKDPNSAGILGSAEYIYHEKLFRYDRAYELSARQVKLGSGNEDFVENHLTTGRFETCSEMAAKMRSEHPEKRIELVMTSLQFACLSGAKKTDAALEAGAQLRTQLTGLQKTGWTFTGTEHFVGSSPAFAPKGEDWVSLFEALREGDEAKAGAALTALDVP